MSEESVQQEDQGYVQDVAFRSGVVVGQSPPVMRYVSLINGLVPFVPTEAFNYCDLGCGEGVTVLALAALFPQSEFYGIDFNPDHIRQARSGADALGLKNARFFEASFTDLDNLGLPSMDYIGCNGIYGWLDPSSSLAVDSFVGDSLKPGGLFYVEYLSMPGKSGIAAMWRFIQSMVPQDQGKNSRQRAEEGIQLLETLAKRGMGFFSQNPSAIKSAKSYIQGRKRDAYRVDHFAHNALARWFTPRFFTEIHDRMSAMGLKFAGRTELFANDLELCVPPAQVPSFLDIKDSPRRELLKDFIRNEHDRRDVWIKEGEENESKALEELAGSYYLLARSFKKNIARQIAAPGGHKVGLIGPAYEELIDAACREPVSLERLEGFKKAPKRYARAFSRLMASGQFHLIVRPDQIVELEETEELFVKGTSLKLSPKVNRWMVARNADRLQGTQLVAPASGGASIQLSPLETLLVARAELKAFEYVPQATLEEAQQAGEDRQVWASGKFKRISDLSLEDLEPVWEAMTGHKLLNIMRLGIGRTFKE